jgi:flagellar biogenesis protein FliO
MSALLKCGPSVALLISTGTLACAQVTNAPVAAGLPGSGSAILALLRVFGALALVFAIFFAGTWVWRNWQRLLTTQGRAPKLAVFEAKSLGQRHTLYVVGYEQERMLIAASPSGVTLLSSLPPAEAASESVVQEKTTAPETATPSGRVAQFGALLLQAIARKS